jgi:hypothetical protein
MLQQLGFAPGMHRVQGMVDGAGRSGMLQLYDVRIMENLVR